MNCITHLVSKFMVDDRDQGVVEVDIKLVGGKSHNVLKGGQVEHLDQDLPRVHRSAGKSSAFSSNHNIVVSRQKQSPQSRHFRRMLLSKQSGKVPECEATGVHRRKVSGHCVYYRRRTSYMDYNMRWWMELCRARLAKLLNKRILYGHRIP